MVYIGESETVKVETATIYAGLRALTVPVNDLVQVPRTLVHHRPSTAYFFSFHVLFSPPNFFFFLFFFFPFFSRMSPTSRDYQHPTAHFHQPERKILSKVARKGTLTTLQLPNSIVSRAEGTEQRPPLISDPPEIQGGIAQCWRSYRSERGFIPRTRETIIPRTTRPRGSQDASSVNYRAASIRCLKS